MKFQYADIEKLSKILDSKEVETMDVAISNGAFCLIPDKRKAFEEVHKMLKPGGRMSICTTTVRKHLEGGKWPLCMRMFIELEKLKPLCEEIGFKNVSIDMENDELEWEMDENIFAADELNNDENSNKRHKVHVGSSEFKHLEDMNMNEICARVVAYGEK